MPLPRTSAGIGVRIFYAAVLLLFIGAGAHSARAETFVVTTVADPGDGTCTAADIGDGCTLREAIDAANSAGGADTIDATGISGVIQLGSALANLSTDINIDGPGASILTVRRNTGGDYRIFTIDASATVNISGLTVPNGHAPDGLNAPPPNYAPGGDGNPGGGVFNRGTLSLTDVVVSGNRSGNGGNGFIRPGGWAGLGGGIYNTGTLTITGCKITGNKAGDGGGGGYAPGGSGGGIYNTGELTIIGSTVTGNQAGNGGGGAGNVGGNGGWGGGIYNSGTITIVTSTVSDNVSGNGVGGFGGGGNGGGGGGISGSGAATLVNITVSGNLSGNGYSFQNMPGVGGGIANGGPMTISNCTISGNRTGENSVSNGLGGGIYHGSGLLTISNSTITSNWAGGGVYCGGTVTLRSTILDGSIFGTIHSDGYNLINVQSGGTISPNPGAGPDFFGYPELGPLAANGGPTRTHLPQRNSLAIDNGHNFSADSTDQRGPGFARTMDWPDATYPNAADGTDIGAVELDGMFQFKVAEQSVSESAGSVTVTVSRNGASDRAVSVSYVTSNGSASAGSDYTTALGTLKWAPEDAADKSFTILITNDSVFEGDETFVVDLFTPVGGVALGTPAKQTITIQNDDVAPSPTATATATATAIPTATASGTPTATATATATPTSSQVLARNISTRAKIETGDNVMIAGFIISGTTPKKVVLRGLGPSLQDMNVVGFLADPVLELRGSNGALILGNDNWQDDGAQAAQIQAAGLAPTRSQESAILFTLVPGTYTAIVRGRNNTTGVGLVEVYDIDNSESQLVNISTRSFVQLQDNVMIGGFTLGGAGNSARIVVRALGPSLSSFGLSSVLQDPTLELRDANGSLLVSNDNWTDDAASAAKLTAYGLALPNPKESGIFLDDIAPGQFTAVVAGKNGGIGIALSEIYNLN